MVKMSRQTESLRNRCIRNLANNFKTIELENFESMPNNLKAIFLKIISKRGNINDENIQVFINHNTKFLELDECGKLTDIGLSKINICKYLTKIDLNSSSEPRPFISDKAICSLSKNCQFLQTVLLRRCVKIEDSCIEALTSNCKNLRNLNLGNCSLITDKALISIGNNCKNLVSINVTATKITDSGVFSLITSNVSKTIEEIHVANCDGITDESIEFILLQCKMIKYLMFHSCKNTTDASRVALENYMTNSSNQKIKHLTWSIYFKY